MISGLTTSQEQLLNNIREQCARRGWFFINANKMSDLDDMRVLEERKLISIEERDVRLDLVGAHVKAGEFVGRLVQP